MECVPCSNMLQAVCVWWLEENRKGASGMLGMFSLFIWMLVTCMGSLNEKSPSIICEPFLYFCLFVTVFCLHFVCLHLFAFITVCFLYFNIKFSKTKTMCREMLFQSWEVPFPAWDSSPEEISLPRYSI